MKYKYAPNEQGRYTVQRNEEEETRIYRSRFDWLSPTLALSFFKQLRDAGVSRRFLDKYLQAKGRHRHMDQDWLKKRESALINMSGRFHRVKKEPWEDKGVLTVDHLWAIAWAHSPIGEKALREGMENG